MSLPISNLAITLTVNGKVYQREVEPRLLLSDFLRHELELTGTHVGCEHGVCGACTVLLDGEAVRSCLLLAVQADGHAIQTVEIVGRRGCAEPASGGVLGGARPAVRFLHTGHSDDADPFPGAKPASRRDRNPRSFIRQFMPLHRIRQHCRGGEIGGGKCAE